MIIYPDDTFLLISYCLYIIKIVRPTFFKLLALVAFYDLDVYLDLGFDEEKCFLQQ